MRRDGGREIVELLAPRPKSEETRLFVRVQMGKRRIAREQLLQRRRKLRHPANFPDK